MCLYYGKQKPQAKMTLPLMRDSTITNSLLLKTETKRVKLQGVYQEAIELVACYPWNYSCIHWCSIMSPSYTVTLLNVQIIYYC